MSLKWFCNSKKSIIKEEVNKAGFLSKLLINEFNWNINCLCTIGSFLIVFELIQIIIGISKNNFC